MQAGFQTIALPLLIVMIMAVLVNYINHFIIKQRAKELATYMLLGMEKDKLALVFLCELFLIGLVCFLLGVALGTGIFTICCHTLLQETGSHSIFRIILKSVLQTFVYFCFVEILSIFFMKRKIYTLQIVQLMREKQRNQPLGAGKKSFWGWMLMISFFGYLALLSGISFMPDLLLCSVFMLFWRGVHDKHTKYQIQHEIIRARKAPYQSPIATLSDLSQNHKKRGSPVAPVNPSKPEIPS